MRKFIPVFFFCLFFSSFVHAADASFEYHRITLLLIAVFFLSKGFGILCDKINVPTLVGEILAGIVLGNLAFLGIHADVATQLQSSPFFIYAAKLGIVLLLFLVGLECSLADLAKVGMNALVTASLGVTLTAVLGFGIAKFMGLGDNFQSLFIGVTFAATSVGITSKVFTEAGKIKTPSAQVVLGAAVVDDVMGLILLAAFSGIITTGSFAVSGLVLILLKVLIFFAASIAFGHYVMPHGFRIYKAIDQPGILTVMAVGFILVFSDLAYLAGLDPIIGAFVAGLLLDDVKLRHADQLKVEDFQDVIKPLMDFLLPLFFVSIGLLVKLETLFDFSNLSLILAFTALAILGKAACGIGCRGKGIDRLGIGLGMIPRGEVQLIFASFGLQRGVISLPIYSVIVLVVLLTTILGPLLLKFRIQKF